MRSEKNTHHCLSSKLLFRETEVSVKHFPFIDRKEPIRRENFFYLESERNFAKEILFSEIRPGKTLKKEKNMESIVTYHATKVSPQEVQRKAEEQYAGGYFCCEAVMSVIRDAFQADVPESVIAMSSGMSIGAGRSGCMCGALNGGILALGMFFGRTTPDGPKDPKVNALMALSKELHDWFRDSNAKHAACCRVLTRGFDMAGGEHKKQCIAFTGLCAGKVAEILCRELGVENVDSEPIKGLEAPYLPPVKEVV